MTIHFLLDIGQRAVLLRYRNCGAVAVHPRDEQNGCRQQLIWPILCQFEVYSNLMSGVKNRYGERAEI